MSIALGIFGGVALLYLGGEGLVRGGAALALRLGIAPLVVGLTIVAMGTSMPELVVSVNAARQGYGGIALGNVVGSNIANIALILGVSALIKPVEVQRKLLQLDVPIAVGSTLLLMLLLADGGLGRLDGALLLAGFFSYAGFTVWEAARRRGAADALEIEVPAGTHRPLTSAVLVVAGLAMLVVGGRVFVEASVALAAHLGVPRAIVGLTVVAIGTSLPEMATSVVAALRGESDLSLGNVVGSNIFNIFCILGITALVQPFSGGQVETADLLVMVGATVLLIPLMLSGFRVSRAEGAFLLLFYVSYLVFLVTSNRLPTP